jgi:protein phosphatase
MSLRGKFASAELTDTGRVREHNEDRIASNLDTALFVLADGMGGYNAGEVASGIAVRTVMQLVAAGCAREERQAVDPATGLMRQTVILRDAISRANKVIHQTARTQPQCQGMGTTIVACLFYDNRVSIAHVGDSRLYRFRQNRLEQLTTDHSLLQELVDRGFYSRQEAARSANRNYVTRALGVEPAVQVELQEAAVEPDDVYLLCSDGLPDMVEHEDIHLTISTFGANLQTAGQQLVQLSNDHGGKDNVSVVLARVVEPFPAPSGVLGRLRRMFS